MKYVKLIIIILIILITLVACQKDKDSFAFAAEEIHLAIDEIVKLEIIAFPAERSYTLTSSNSAIVKIDGEFIIALREGIATVTGASGDFSDTIRVVVTSSAIKNPHQTYYAVTFMSARGVMPTVQYVLYGNYATRPNAPDNAEGYVFSDWYGDTNFTTLFDFENTPITKNTYIYANWDIDYDNIEFAYHQYGGDIYISGFFYEDIEYSEVEFPAFVDETIYIKGLKDEVFQNNQFLEKITIPSTYEYIGKSAFSGAAKLKDVIFTSEPGNITKIEDRVFENCISLESINLPDSIIEIGEFAFFNTVKLQDFSLPLNINRIKKQAFFASGIKSIDLNNATTLDEYAFYNSELEDVIYSDKLVSIGRDVFWGTVWIASEMLAKGHLEINDILLNVYTNTTTFIVPSNISKIASGCFTFSNNIEIIFDTANIPTLTTLGLPQQYDIIVPYDYYYDFFNSYSTAIKQNIWYSSDSFDNMDYEFNLLRKRGNDEIIIKQCTTNVRHVNLTEIFTGFNIKKIRYLAFNTTTSPNIEIINIPSSVQTIERHAFNGNIRALFIDNLDNNLPILEGNPINSLISGKYKLYVHSSRINAFINHFSQFLSPGYIFDSSIYREDGLCISIVGENAYIVQYLGNATTLTIQSSYEGKRLAGISAYAFTSNKSLTEITFEGDTENIITIGEQAFYGLSNLIKIIFNYSNPPSIGAQNNYVFGTLSTMNYDIIVTSENINTYQTAWAYYSNKIKTD